MRFLAVLCSCLLLLAVIECAPSLDAELQEKDLNDAVDDPQDTESGKQSHAHRTRTSSQFRPRKHHRTRSKSRVIDPNSDARLRVIVEKILNEYHNTPRPRPRPSPSSKKRVRTQPTTLLVLLNDATTTIPVRSEGRARPRKLKLRRTTVAPKLSRSKREIPAVPIAEKFEQTTSSASPTITFETDTSSSFFNFGPDDYDSEAADLLTSNTAPTTTTTTTTTPMAPSALTDLMEPSTAPPVTIAVPQEFAETTRATTTLRPSDKLSGITVPPPTEVDFAEAEEVIRQKTERRKIEEAEWYRTSTEFPTTTAATTQSAASFRPRPYTGTTQEPTLFEVFTGITPPPLDSELATARPVKVEPSLENARFMGRFALQNDPEKSVAGIVEAVAPALDSPNDAVLMVADVGKINDRAEPRAVVVSVKKALKKVRKVRRRKIRKPKKVFPRKQLSLSEVVETPKPTVVKPVQFVPVHQKRWIPELGNIQEKQVLASSFPEPGQFLPAVRQVQPVLPLYQASVRPQQFPAQQVVPSPVVRQPFLAPTTTPASATTGLPRPRKGTLRTRSGQSLYKPSTSQQAQEVLEIIKELRNAQSGAQNAQSFSIFSTSKQSYFILPNGRVLVVAEESKLAKHKLEDADKVKTAPRGKRMLRKLKETWSFEEPEMALDSVAAQRASRVRARTEHKMRQVFGDDAIDSVAPLSVHDGSAASEVETSRVHSNGRAHGQDLKLLSSVSSEEQAIDNFPLKSPRSGEFVRSSQGHAQLRVIKLRKSLR